MSEQSTILIGVCIYMLVMLGIGIYAAKRTSSADDFMVAGRSLPLWLCAGSVMATWLGGGSMMGVSGLAYEGGLLAVIADPFGAAVGLVLVGLLVVRLLRRLRLLTVIDFIQNRFGRAAALFSAIGMVSSSIGWSGALMVAFGSVFHALTGLSMELGIVIGGSCADLYRCRWHVGGSADGLRPAHDYHSWIDGSVGGGGAAPGGLACRLVGYRARHSAHDPL